MKRLLAVSVVVVLVMLHAPGASAATVAAVGWWTRSPAASAPEGGITVSNSPDGPVSVAAVRLDLGSDGVTSAVITLPQTGGAAATAAHMVVCVLTAQWQPTTAGALADAPATTCTGTSAPLTLNGTDWTADVGELVGDRKGVVGFAIVPGTGTTGVFDLQFGRPAVQATAARSTTPTTRPSTTPTTQSQAAPARPATTFSAPAPPRAAITTTTAAITPTTIDNFVANVAPESEVAFGGRSGTGGEGGSGSGRPVGQAIVLALLATVIGVVGGFAHKVASARAV